MTGSCLHGNWSAPVEELGAGGGRRKEGVSFREIQAATGTGPSGKTREDGFLNSKECLLHLFVF